MAVPTTIKLPCYETRYLNDIGHRVQCVSPNGHHGAHTVTYGAVGFSWNSNGKVQCPIRHASNGVRCLAQQGHGFDHEGISLHGGELMKWHRVVTATESDLGKPPVAGLVPPRSQAYVDKLMEKARNGYVTAEPVAVPAPEPTWADLSQTIKKLTQPSPLDSRQWIFEEMISQAVVHPSTAIKLTDGAPLDPDTGLTAHDAVPDEPEARSYEERKARRNRRNR